DLTGEDDEGDPAGEAGYDGEGDELDHRSEPREPESDQEKPRHDRRHEEAVHPVGLDDTVNDDDEGPGRPADLDARSPQEGNQESGYDGGIESSLGSDAACNRERDCQGEGHDPDDHSGYEVCAKLREGVAPQRG